MSERLSTWGEVCQRAGMALESTAADAPVERLISAPSIAVPKGDSDYKSMGFTKLVRRDKGVYENVTATDKEKRYVVQGDASSMPDFKRKIRD